MSRTIPAVRRRAVAAVFAVAALLPAQSESIDLTFGVYTTDKPTAMYTKFTPLLHSLESAMEQRVKASVSIQIRIFKSYAQARRALVKGDVDFVRFGPASYVLAKQENPKIELLAMESVKGEKTFKGYIVVRGNSPIKKLVDLRGKRFAFGDRTSTIGRFLAQEKLFSAGIRADCLASHVYLGRHDKVFRAVQRGKYDAGAVKSGTFDKLNAKTKPAERLRVLDSFDNVTKPWVGRPGLPDTVSSALRAALLHLDDEAALGSLKADALVPARDEDYDDIRRSMAVAEKFTSRSKPEPKPPK